MHETVSIVCPPSPLHFEYFHWFWEWLHESYPLHESFWPWNRQGSEQILQVLQRDMQFWLTIFPSHKTPRGWESPKAWSRPCWKLGIGLPLEFHFLDIWLSICHISLLHLRGIYFSCRSPRISCRWGTVSPGSPKCQKSGWFYPSECAPLSPLFIRVWGLFSNPPRTWASTLLGTWGICSPQIS